MTRNGFDDTSDWGDSGDPPNDSPDSTDLPSWPWLVAPLIVLTVAVVAVVAFGFVTSIGCGCPQMTPQPVLDFDHDEGTVTITHEGGDTFTEENTGTLAVHVNHEEHRSIPLPFETRDTVTVEGVEPGDEVWVVWTDPDPDAAAAQTLAQYTVPDE